MKVFARKKKLYCERSNDIYYNQNISNAVLGFSDMGFEIIDYYNVNEIYDEYELGDILLDGILQVNYVLSKVNVKTNNIDYPDVLKKYLGRNIWVDTINHINNNPNLWPVFVKPIEDKKFTGVLIREPKDLIGCGSCYDNATVLCSEPVEFIYECRGFVYYDEMIDLRPYRGNYINMNKMNCDIIYNALNDFNSWKERPNACSLDFGVTSDGRTLFIEQNSAYSLGCYGLNSIDYAKLISACISQLSGTKDECKF